MTQFKAVVVPAAALLHGDREAAQIARNVPPFHRAERAPRIVFPVELLESSRHGIRIVTRSEIVSRRIVHRPCDWCFPQDPRPDFFRRERSAPSARSAASRTEV